MGYEVALYLDGVGFAHKTDPMDQARAPTGRIYRKKSEGLDQYCTAKGSKVGTGGKVAIFQLQFHIMWELYYVKNTLK